MKLNEWLLPSVLFGVWIGIVFGLVPIIMRILRRFARKTRTKLDDILIDSLHFPLILILLSLGLKLWMDLVPLSQKGIKYTQIATIILLVFGIVLFLDKMLVSWVKFYSNRVEFVKTSSGVLQTLFRIAIVAVGILIVLDTLGISITPLIASLGVGGIAIAFALQNILSDIFASFSIYLDRPFQLGDFIIIGNDLGTVKKIGIKSTRIQTLHGEELVLSNKEMTETRIHNYKKMEKRRIDFSFGVTYGTPTEKLKKIPSIIKDIIDKVKLADLDRVHFKKFGDFSLDFEVVYYLSSSDYNKYMDTQQEINLATKEQFEKEGIEFAYPTQTVFVNK